jgi:hypothetical protein
MAAILRWFYRKGNPMGYSDIELIFELLAA